MSEIKEQVQNFIHKYLDVHPEAEVVIADYALRTWQPRPKAVKYLQFVGMPNSGKTRAGAVMAAICQNPLEANGNMSPASLLYLMDEKCPCTLILDDTFTHNDPESTIAKILIFGAEDSNRIWNAEPRALEVFGYKVVISTRKFREPAIQSKCITVKLTETERNEIPRFLSGEFEKDSAEIQQALTAFYAGIPAFAL